MPIDYEPALVEAAVLAAAGDDRAFHDERDPLYRIRYRVLWDAHVDGRLVAEGRAPLSVRAARLQEFRRAFPELDGEAEAAFARFFEARRCTHADLVARARAPVV